MHVSHCNISIYVRTFSKVLPQMDKKPITFSTIDGDIGKRLNDMYGANPSFLRVQPSGCLFPPQYVFYARKIRDMEVREDDVWLISYPRTGSHWAQEMIWCIGNNFNYDKSETLMVVRNPLLESSSLMVTGNYVEWFAKLGDSVENVINMPSPRYVKTHLPWELLPDDIHRKRPKIIYITRNPKDTCVSFYHYCKLFHNIQGNFEDFAELMLNDYAPLGSFWKHVLRYWENRDQDNILFLTYEEMKKNQIESIKKAAKFLNKEATEEQIHKLSEHLNFSKMAANPAINLQRIITESNGENENSDFKFIRKGKVGDWKNHMSEDLARSFDEWIEKNSRGTGLKFDMDNIKCDEE
ncbi:hypothetical protein KM043_007155 [Ampulex compressa]|nr:hypothetical protein KM043_007155 [Ampulex compressa]